MRAYCEPCPGHRNPTLGQLGADLAAAGPARLGRGEQARGIAGARGDDVAAVREPAAADLQRVGDVGEQGRVVTGGGRGVLQELREVRAGLGERGGAARRDQEQLRGRAATGSTAPPGAPPRATTCALVPPTPNELTPARRGPAACGPRRQLGLDPERRAREVDLAGRRA